MLVDKVGAILLICENAERLADFYRSVLGLPLVDEVHEGVPLHYACELGAVHVAIHPAETWPGEATKSAQSPVIVFEAPDATAVFDKLQEHNIPATPPFDHGFATIVSFRDLDGNNVQIMELSVSGV